MNKTALFLMLITLSGTTWAQDLQLGSGKSELRERDRILLDRLNRESLNVEWRDQSLLECVQELRTRTNCNILVSGAAADAEFLVPDLKLHNVSVLLVLQLLAEESGLHLQFRRGLVIFKTPEEALCDSAVTVVYDLGSRFYQPSDYPGPKLGLGASGTEEAERETEIRPEAMDFDAILDILRSATGEKNWDSEHASMSMAGKRLFVRHHPAMQVRIKNLLNALSRCY